MARKVQTIREDLDKLKNDLEKLDLDDGHGGSFAGQAARYVGQALGALDQFEAEQAKRDRRIETGRV